MIKRLLVANRGEIAVRIMATASVARLSQWDEERPDETGSFIRKWLRSAHGVTTTGGGVTTTGGTYP